MARGTVRAFARKNLGLYGRLMNVMMWIECCVQCKRQVRRVVRNAAGLPDIWLLVAIILPLSFASASSTLDSLPHLFSPRHLPPLPLIPRPPVCDMAHATIVHAGDEALSAFSDDSTASNRCALMVHLPSFDLSAVAAVQIIIDGSPASPLLPPFNDGGPLIMKASGFKAGDLLFTIKTAALQRFRMRLCERSAQERFIL